MLRSGLSSSRIERRADLGEVVRRDAGRHPDGDPGGAVDEQVRQPRRQHDRLGLRAVVVRAERHGVLVDLAQHLVGDPREPALRVPHGGGAVAVERPEVAGAVHQRIAQRERLRHPDQRLVDGRVAVRVVAAHHVADHLGALAVLGVGGQVLLPHRVEDAALDRLQAVAHVRQRARGDDRQRVVQVARLRRLVQTPPARATSGPPPAAVWPISCQPGGAAPAGMRMIRWSRDRTGTGSVRARDDEPTGSSGQETGCATGRIVQYTVDEAATVGLSAPGSRLTTISI